MYNISNLLPVFKSIFKGRDDVFAIRWEKGNKSGYMPAFTYDPYLYRTHKMRGGTFQNFNDKTFLKFTDSELLKHLNGEQLIGIYPLLKDNNSYFIVADFDEANWIDECRIFLNVCNEIKIPAYLERSQSGNGGHVWIFFDQPYPAYKSRKILISILENTRLFSVFNKSLSFDRLFPNQDFHSGKGFGNLIALPLYKKSFEKGNSCFIDSETLYPIKDQIEFLNNIKKITIPELDQIFNSISISSPTELFLPNSGKLFITLSNVVRINRNAMRIGLINFLKTELNFANSEFFIKKKIGKSTFKVEQYFNFVEEKENEISIPKGFIGKLIRFCRDNSIDYDFIDERKKHTPIPYTFNAKLKDYQQKVIDNISKKEIGVIVAPPGSGKTIIALKIIADKQQPALIIVHRKQLIEQWKERIEAFLGIPKSEIGQVGSSKKIKGKKITIATIQSLSKELTNNEGSAFFKEFGTIIVDECHHIPAETYRNTITKLHSFYLYGLTATPYRKYNDGKLIFMHLGEVIAEIKSDEISTMAKPKIIIRNTDLDVPFNSKTDNFETLSKILVHDTARNKLIIEDVIIELKSSKRIAIITERKEHIETLNQYFKQSYETLTLSGDDSESSRKYKWQELIEGNYQVLITTGQFFGEGTDIQGLNCLFLIYPFSFEGKLIQYIGRVQRSELTPTIYDFRDIHIDYLNKLFLKRNTYYRKIDKQLSLFEEPKEIPDNPIKLFNVEKEVKIPIEHLEFNYGSVSFKYLISELSIELIFEIENLDIRPEFDVLKPYFAKTIKSKNIKFKIYAEFEGNKLVSQLATSKDIEKINSEVIDCVKFTFISKHFLAKTALHNGGLLDTNQSKNEFRNKLYNSAEDLLEDVLKHKNFKHSKQLRYLSSQHDRKTMKIRFLLNPFSFVFLISGDEHFHVLLETLDTEEATYIWYFTKDKTLLKSKLNEIDHQLNVIRSKGKLSFLENPPSNFNRILHDYTDDNKGFILWKDTLREHLK